MLDLAADRRALCARILGEELLSRGDRLSPQPLTDERRVRLPDLKVTDDCRLGWLVEPIERLYASLDAAVAIDFESNEMGRIVPARIPLLVKHAEEAAEIAGFLRTFESWVVDLVEEALGDALTAVSALLRAITSESDSDAAEAAATLADRLDRVRNHHRRTLSRLKELQVGEVDEAFSEIALVLRLDPSLVGSPGDTMRALQEAGYDLVEVGARQIGYLGDFTSPGDVFDINYWELATRIGTSPFPLLAHRAAFLVTALVRRAYEADRETTLDFIGDFFSEQRTWIMAARPRFENALARFGMGEITAIFEAYRELAEGVLRRFGSAVLALDELAAGRVLGDSVVRPTLGPVADELSARDDLAPQLLSHFVEPRLRNAGAHSNVAVGAGGAVMIHTDDGGVVNVDAFELEEKTVALRAALTGVDLALNLPLMQDVVPSGRMWDVGSIAEEEVAFIAIRVARHQTFSEIVSCHTRGGVVTVVFASEPSQEELSRFAASFLRFLPEDVARLEAVNPDGDLLGWMQRTK